MIKFKNIRWRNFLSTGAQQTEIYFDRSPTTLIVGENGAGKSTILDALCFTLFGKPFRNINKPQLVNSINGKNCSAEVEFSIGTKQYKIVRGIKPNVFEIYLNGELLNQDAATRDYQKYLEEHVIKLNYKSFTQIVILGSASFTPFMQLPAAHRREVIEDLLDIKIFSVMNDVLKDKIGDVKSKIQELENDIEVGKTKVKLQQEYIKTLESDKQKIIEDVRKRILEANEEITTLAASVEAKQNEEDDLKALIVDAGEKRKLRLDVDVILKKIAEKIRNQEKNIEFYNDHDTCPTCSQLLDETLKKTAITEHSCKITELKTATEDLTQQLSDIEKRLDEITEVEDRISDCKSKIIELNTKIIASQNYIAKLQQDLDSSAGEQGNIEEEKNKLKALAKEVIKASEDKSKLDEEKHYYDVAGILLKDTGIKTRVIKQYLPVINKLVNKYLQAMDFFVSFELDEAFNEKIKSRHRDEFSYASFSEGEKARIDISILLAFRSIAKMKNTANTNLLIMDEVFDSSLDINGADFVMNLLNTIGDGTNTFVISHKDSLFDKFRSVIRFEKKNNFSVMAR